MDVRQEISLTSKVPFPNYYIKALTGELSEWAFSEERALGYKGKWREEIFSSLNSIKMDLEIGTGNGNHFAYLAKLNNDRCLLGIELKYKPLIQSIRLALKRGSLNAKILRYDASYLQDLFEKNELDNVYIHFPDPWPKRRQRAHRLINSEFLKQLFELQSNQSFVDIKTDSENYFNWIREEFENSSYKQTRFSLDLHNSQWQAENFVTQFERIFMRKGQPIYYMRLVKAKNDGL